MVDWMDLRVGNRGYSNRVQDAMPWVEIDLLYAVEAGVQGVGADQFVGSAPPSSAMGAGFGRDLPEQALSFVVRLRRRPTQVAAAPRLHQHHCLPFHLSSSRRLLHAPCYLPHHREIHHPHGWN